MKYKQSQMDTLHQLCGSLLCGTSDASEPDTGGDGDADHFARAIRQVCESAQSHESAILEFANALWTGAQIIPKDHDDQPSAHFARGIRALLEDIAEVED